MAIIYFTKANDKLDFTKANDKVPHKRLIDKLKYYGITGLISSWIESFLAERTQHVVKNGTANTNHRLLSITVIGIHTWNGLGSEITQLPSL